MSIKDHQNPDGTWNGVGVLSELTGVSRDEVEAAFNEVKANNQTLSQCDYHEFTLNPDLANPDSPVNRSKRHKCKNCGGVVSEVMWRWFEIGRQQQRK